MGMRMTLESVRLRLLVIPFAAAALTVACGEEHLLQSPTGPSGTVGATTFQTSDDGADSIDTLAKGGIPGPPGGHGDTDGEDPDSDKVGPGQGNTGNPGRSHQGRVVGFVSAKAGDVLTVNGIGVVAGVDAIIRHGHRVLTIADIEVGDHLQARGTLEAGTLVAVEIKVQDTGHNNDDVDDAALEGLVSGLSGTCPAVTFLIGTTQVSTDAATSFDDVTCAALANGARVEVEGATQADLSVLATKVEAQAGPDEVEGIVFELAGACPTAELKVGPVLSLAIEVNTTAGTTYTGLADCSAVANGQHVEVEGTLEADGSITAVNIELH